MLFDQIMSAQAGDKNTMMALVEQFFPIIRKYGRKLDPEDGTNEMILYFIELIHQMDIHKLKSPNDGAIVNYIEQCIYHFYIKMKNGQNENHILHWEELPEYHKAAIEKITAQEEIPLDWSFPLQILTEKERSVIIQIYEYGFSSAEIAKNLGVSRQNVNQIKKRAEAKIRSSLRENN